MLRSEIIRTCSHQAVAAAALLSLGSEFHGRVSLLAGAHDMSPGAYTAHLVKQFATDADEDAWYALGNAIAYRDMPVLSGLRYILEAMIDGEASRDAGTGKVRQRMPQTRRHSRKIRPVELGEFFA